MLCNINPIFKEERIFYFSNNLDTPPDIFINTEEKYVNVTINGKNLLLEFLLFLTCTKPSAF